jgi:hypothetical protein
MILRLLIVIFRSDRFRFARYFFPSEKKTRSNCLRQFSLWNFLKFRYYWILTSQSDLKIGSGAFEHRKSMSRIFYQKTSLPTPRPLRHDFDQFLKMSKKCQNRHFGGFWHFFEKSTFWPVFENVKKVSKQAFWVFLDFFENRLFDPKIFNFFSKSGHFCSKLLKVSGQKNYFLISDFNFETQIRRLVM